MRNSIMYRTLFSGALLLALVSPALGQDEMPVSGTDGTTSVDLAFITHLDADLPEQDVFIERVEGSGEVFRVTKGDHNMGAPLFAAAEMIEHDPANPDAVGPHPKGRSLGMTLGEWLKHQGTGTYTCTDGAGSLDVSFTGLVPNGVYTMWHAFVVMPHNPKTGILELPLGERDGSDAAFTADADGNASFVRNFKPCLQMSDTWTTAMLALNYHSDGETYGAYAGQFGIYAHIPLFLILPNREGI
ncbi:MAG: hypothetical protein ABFS14_11660 [Gemmatimonadota bacterium]